MSRIFIVVDCFTPLLQVENTKLTERVFSIGEPARLYFQVSYRGAEVVGKGGGGGVARIFRRSLTGPVIKL